jgi:hypothetical protein
MDLNNDIAVIAPERLARLPLRPGRSISFIPAVPAV